MILTIPVIIHVCIRHRRMFAEGRDIGAVFIRLSFQVTERKLTHLVHADAFAADSALVSNVIRNTTAL